MAQAVIMDAVSVPEASGVPLMGRVRLTTGAYITQATVSVVTIKVFLDGTQVGAEKTPSVASTIYDTLQTVSDDPLWTKDSTGYNFKYVLLNTALVDGDNVYDVWVFLAPSSGPRVAFQFRVHTIDVPGE